MSRLILLMMVLAAAASATVSPVVWEAVPGRTGEYRARIAAAPAGSQLMIVPGSVVEIRAEGRLLGRTERIGPAVFDLPASSEPLQIIVSGRSEPQPPAAWVGDAREIEAQIIAWQVQRFRETQAAKFLCTALLTGGIFFLLIPIYRPDSREYLWCGLYFLFGAGHRAFGFFPEIFVSEYASGSRFVTLFSTLQVAVVWPALCRTLLRSRLGWLSWIAIAACVATMANWMLHPATMTFLIASLTANTTEPLVYLDTLLRRKSTERLGPVHWALTILLTASVCNSIVSLQGVGTYYSADLLHTALSYTILAFMFGMGVILNRRAAAADQTQGRLTQELRAAAEIQSLLLPAQLTHGVEAVYLPAAEVGGDFYQVFDRAGGSRVILLGDVSGKGLKAAMLASVAVGALRHNQTDSPSEILADLNRVLCGHTGGGFVTCCCVFLQADGRGSIASAGHLSPYRNGREIEVAPGLPLGLSPITAWAETPVDLSGGEQLTIVSDGVIEASNPNGDLFGFERTREISTKSAQEIAEAARAWGQNDDITVVTVRRTSV